MMMVQEYLKANGLAKLQEEFKIEIRDYPEDNLVVLNYNQIFSPKSHPICNECRALILRKGTWEVLARSFDKFFNAGERAEDKDFPISQAIIYEKLDGCCNENTLLTTSNGIKTIRDICEKQEKVKVLAYDIQQNRVVWADIEGFSIKKNNNDWYKIEMGNQTITLTGNHYVWLPEFQCYRQVKDLKEGDIVLLRE